MPLTRNKGFDRFSVVMNSRYFARRGCRDMNGVARAQAKLAGNMKGLIEKFL
jgi:hypothetical protein